LGENDFLVFYANEGGKMKRVIFVSVCILSVLILTSGAAAPGPSASSVAGASHRWLLCVKPGFSPSDVSAIGGTCLWYWEDAGIAAVDSINPNFGALVKGRTIDFAVADIAAKPQKRLAVPQAAGSAPPFDAYASNYQWYWQAIGAVKVGPGNVPEWQLGDYAGSGVKVATIDTGAPASWSDWYLGSDGWIYPTADATFSLHPEFNEYDPAHPESGGVVLLRDTGGNVMNYDDFGHGTAVGSTLLAQHRGEGAMRGLAPKVTLYCHRIDMANWYSSALEGWFKAAEFGCQILNNSWYGVELPVERYEDFKLKFPIIFRRAAVALHQRGVLIVAASSNDAIDANKDGDSYYIYNWGTWFDNHGGFSSFMLIPQDLPNVIVAGGTGPADYDPFASDLTVYDPWTGGKKGGQKGREFNLDRTVNSYIPPAFGGPWVSGSTYGTFLNVAAPMGGNVKDWGSPDLLFQMMYLASAWGGFPGEGHHDYWSGTSFSSPITCGVAALAAEAYFRAHGVMPSPSTLANILMGSADDMVGPATDDLWVWNEKTYQFEFTENVPADTAAKDIRYGFGRVNPKKAIELAQR
jgi:hypothetical protein